MTHFVSTQILQHGYLAIFLLMLLESACIPIPSEAIMLFGGALSGGFVVAGNTAHVTLWEVALVGAAGNVVGSLVVYGVGRYGGTAILQNPAVARIVRPRHVRSGEDFFDRHGNWAVLIGRLLPVIRTFISLPAGIARMPVGRFTVLTAVGCLPWTFALTIMGYYVAGSWDSVASGFTPVSIAIALVTIGALIWWWRRSGDRSAERTDEMTA